MLPCSFVPLPCTRENGKNLNFPLNRQLVNHDASLAFSFQNGGGVTLASGDRLLVVAIQTDGVDPSTERITDTNYVVAMETIL